jgi:CHAT domain-containing protein/tetratricopeptide (TPR) repeat protein
MLTPALLDELLAISTPAAQTAYLQAAGLCNKSGLSALLDAAERLAGDDPDCSHRLAETVEHVAGRLDAPALLPRAAYLQAQTFAIKGDFGHAGRLITHARQGYLQLNLHTEALRTTVGLMRVLGETGRYPEALAAAQQALAEIGATVGAPVAEAVEQRAVAAMIFQNCGYCYEQIGRYDDALAVYAAAEQRYAELGMVEEQAQIIENRGLVLMALGQVRAGLAAFEEALTHYDQDARSLFQAQTYLNIGEAHLLLSNYLPSLRAFEQAASRFETLGETVDRYILLRQKGDAYLALNLYAEAEDAYRQARRGLASAGLALHHALTLWGLGTVLTARGRLSEASQVMAEAAQALRTLDNRPLLSAVMLEESELRELAGDELAARQLAQAALDLVAASNWTVQKTYAYLRNADLALPDVGAAAPLLAQAQSLVERLQLPHLRYRLRQRWGRLHLLQGDAAGAQEHLETAIAEIERLRSTLVQERLRASFLADKTAAYQDLVRLHLDRKNEASIRRAFAVADQAKSRALVDLIAGTVEARPGETTDLETARQLQQLQTELNAVYSEMLGGHEEARMRRASATTLQARATELEQAISHLRLRQQLLAGVPADEFASSSAMQHEQLAPPTDESLVVYHILDDEILAFVAQGEQLHVMRRLSTVETVRRLFHRLAVQWERLGSQSAFVQQHHAQLQMTATRTLQQLYDELMAPLLPLLEAMATGPATSVGRLVIVPHGLLHQIPFQALHDGEHFLIERFAISYAPSATVLALCRQRQRRSDGLAVVMAVADSRIPAAEVEALQVASVLRRRHPEVAVLVGEQVTAGAFRNLANSCGLVHLACHSLFRRDNPMFSALKLYDGWLTAADVAELGMQGALVVLSACESGRSQVLGGDEILGLTYAFLSAGAATVLVSQWLVQDEITASLMARWYHHLADGQDLALALRAAQLEIMADHPHPYLWAPFALVGQHSPL